MKKRLITLSKDEEEKKSIDKASLMSKSPIKVDSVDNTTLISNI